MGGNTGEIATPCGAIFKGKCYGSVRGIILHVRVVIARTSFSFMGLVRPKSCRGTGGGRVQRASSPSRGGGTASCIFRGCFETFQKSVCKYFFLRLRQGRHVFSIRCKTRRRGVYGGYSSFSHSMRFVLISSIRQKTISTTRLRVP